MPPVDPVVCVIVIEIKYFLTDFFFSDSGGYKFYVMPKQKMTPAQGQTDADRKILDMAGEIEKRIADLRGQPFRKPVGKGILNKKQLKTYLLKMFEKELPDEIPEYVIKADEINLIDILRDSQMCKSGGEARRLIKQNAVSISGKKISDVFYKFIPEDGMIIKAGKRRFLKLKVI